MDLLWALMDATMSFPSSKNIISKIYMFLKNIKNGYPKMAPTLYYY